MQCPDCLKHETHMCPELGQEVDTGVCAHYKSTDDMTLEDLKGIYDEFLYIDDPDMLDVVFAVRLAIHLPGDPLWLFVIAPPGGSKTEILRALKGDDVYTVSTITSHTLVSGMSGGDKLDLLPKLDGKLLVLKDFTSILTDEHDRTAIFSQLRETYDGYYEKAFGSIEGKKSYKAEFGCLAAVTPVIDAYQTVNTLLGERFLKLRIKTDPKKVIKKAQEMAGREKAARERLAAATSAFIKNMRGVTKPNEEIPDEIIERINFLADFVARMRSVVARDRMKNMLYVPESEVGTRLVKQMKKLAVALSMVRAHVCVDADDYETIKRVGIDSIPNDRWRLWKALVELQPIAFETEDGEPPFPNTKAIATQVKMPTTTTKEKLEDMWALGLVERHGTTEYLWKPCHDITELFEDAGL